MTFEELSQSWKRQKLDPAPGTEDQLRQAMRRAKRFKARIFWRDARELAASLFAAGVFGYASLSQPALAAFGSLFAAAMALCVGAFFALDRLSRRSSGRRGAVDARSELRRSLAEIDHQIRLLRNVAWWYLGPLALGTVVFVVAIALSIPAATGVRAAFIALALVAVGAADWFVYKLNQLAVERNLIPQREELAALIEQWDDPPKRED